VNNSTIGGGGGGRRRATTVFGTNTGGQPTAQRGKAATDQTKRPGAGRVCVIVGGGTATTSKGNNEHTSEIIEIIFKIEWKIAKKKIV
jgi:hypothetical protein